jgi:hypothetical protein
VPVSIEKVLEDAKSLAVEVFSRQVMEYLTTSVWVGFGWAVINPLVSYLVGLVLSIGLQRLDWLTFMLVENWASTEEGIAYAKAANDLAGLPTTATPEDLKKAEDAKVDAFRRLIGLGSLSG